MPTLRDIWKQKGMTSTQVAGLAGISVPSLYKLNRKEEDVNFSTVRAVCKVLGLSLDEFANLDPCPQAEKHRGKS